MEYCIYHSRDLDGLTSGAIIYSHQTSFGDDCNLIPYDYGEKLDTRRFKGKSTIMIDVSMDMDRMEMLAINAMEFIWIDHHVSAYKKLIEYCREKDYGITEFKYNDLVTRIEVKAMNMIYFYSERLSGCEIAAVLYAKNLTKNSREVISILGQYDTWRNSDEKKFAFDKDWNKVVFPVQYYMRSCKSPLEVYNALKKIDAYHDPMSLEEVIKHGESILRYHNNINDSQAKKFFEFEFEGLKVIALNTHFFNSQTFDQLYHPDIHDAMMPFVFNGKTKEWLFSLYTTKEDVDLLSVATKYGGGGHPKACGFSISADLVSFDSKADSCISIKENYILNVSTDKKENKPNAEFSKQGCTHFLKDEIDYLIPNILKPKIEVDLGSLSPEEFAKKYTKYKV